MQRFILQKLSSLRFFFFIIFRIKFFLLFLKSVQKTFNHFPAILWTKIWTLTMCVYVCSTNWAEILVQINHTILYIWYGQSNQHELGAASRISWEFIIISVFWKKLNQMSRKIGCWFQKNSIPFHPFRDFAGEKLAIITEWYLKQKSLDVSLGVYILK